MTDLIFITGRNKRAIEDHFDKAYELETELEIRNKEKLLEGGAGHLCPSGPRASTSASQKRWAWAHAVLCAPGDWQRTVCRAAGR